MKLMVLQVLSPIPIIMSVIPGQNKRLSDFARNYFSIWLQVLIRLITIYLAFVVCNIVIRVSFTINISMPNVLLNARGIVIIILYIERILYYGYKEFC